MSTETQTEFPVAGVGVPMSDSRVAQIAGVVDANPYASPNSNCVGITRKQLPDNFQMLRLAHTLRYHGYLTLITVAIFGVEILTVAWKYEIVGLFCLMLGVTSCFLWSIITLMAIFRVFPLPAALLALSAMLVPLAWPIILLSLHWYGRITLRENSMALGVFGGINYLADLAD